MTTYIVTYAHPDEAGWQAQLMPHIAWLNERVADGSLLASGPLPGEGVKRALLILRAADRAALDALIASDPFAEHGLIADQTVAAWDPIFGAFNALSSLPRG
ncbi:MAG: YciI family protein [Pseudomonadota bacterium]